MNKAKALPSTQAYVNLAQIQDGIVITRDRKLERVLLVSPLNMALKSEQEQNAIIGQYQNFLNSLNFSIQIVIQSKKLDLGPHLALLKSRLQVETNELIRLQLDEYMYFLQRLINVVNVMDKRFLVVIPFSPSGAKREGVWDFLPRQFIRAKTAATFSQTEFNSYKQELDERTNVVRAGLNEMGLNAQPLNTQQIIELYYGIYNPEEATREKLAPAETLQAEIIEKEPSNAKPV